MNKNDEKMSREKKRQTSNGELHRRRKAIRRKNNLLLASVLGVSVMVIVLIIALVSKKNAQLIGIWQYDQYTKYEFSANGEGCLYVDDVHYEYKYKVSGDELKIDFIEDIVRDCEYSFDINNVTETINRYSDKRELCSVHDWWLYQQTMHWGNIMKPHRP